MKIGILTFHRAHNYGAVLQTLGTYYALKEYGYESEIINYMPFPVPIISRFRGFGIKGNILSFLFNLKSNYKSHKNTYTRFKKFDKFILQYLKLSPFFNSFYELKKYSVCYDLVIVGSDQVWNFYTTNNVFCPEYYLNFVDCVKISYAASCGVNQPKNIISEIQSYLKDFKAISVRDDLTKMIVNKSDNNIQVVCDPTFLIDYSQFISIGDRFKKLPPNFILVYAFNKISGFEETIFLIKEYLKIPVVTIGSQELKYSDFTFLDCGTDEWLYLIKKASFVFTHSFHGIIFSIKENKNFIAYGYSQENIRNERVLDLSRRYNFQNRILFEANIESINEILYHKPNYKSINNLVEQHIQDSVNFLKTNMSKFSYDFSNNANL